MLAGTGTREVLPIARGHLATVALVLLVDGEMNAIRGQRERRTWRCRRRRWWRCLGACLWKMASHDLPVKGNDSIRNLKVQQVQYCTDVPSLSQRIRIGYNCPSIQPPFGRHGIEVQRLLGLGCCKPWRSNAAHPPRSKGTSISQYRYEQRQLPGKLHSTRHG